MSGPKVTTNLLKQLRNLMQNAKYANESIQAYIVPSIDAHNSEYLAECDKLRSFISGFDGSAGTALITQNKALMWTDGRYYLQASKQMDSNWLLMKEGDPNTPKQASWLVKNLPSGSRVGVDPKLITYDNFVNLKKELETVGHKLIPVNANLVELLWDDRPKRSLNPIEPLPLLFSGKPVGEKLKEVVGSMREENAKYLVLTALDQIAWFLNLRGSDIEFNPVFFSYVIVSSDSRLVLFVDPQQATEKVRRHLSDEAGNIFEIKPYDSIENHLKDLAGSLDRGFVWFSDSSSYALTSIVPKKHLLLTDTTPVELMKAIKNPVEVRGMRNAHVKDAAALCCYFAWLEKQVPKGTVTEISGANKLHEFRKLQLDFVGDSFDTISSVGPHGAIIHYKPDASSDTPIRSDCLYLCDSGAQFRDGTTDVTRTLHFGTPTNYEKECYTRVLKGQLKLARSVFPMKIKGNYLDSFAREYLWEAGLDYPHGTGHGIGHYLNVHEGPMGISWRPINQDPGLQPNMFLSNEPGYYEDARRVPQKVPRNCWAFVDRTRLHRRQRMVVEGNRANPQVMIDVY
ncbi:xaa-Pro aminopeptidase 1 isoform X2 [Cylas formicarius]|uniref:xaa-Pro aminopeptidase 1 isoform X2 n=1 Tax=Cylas formicarius TaxID=197179 RepID=UPI002958B7E6|nr:xaa-Pro aminopeptidase 1 isoform X2 [Cylas formicarius]